MEDRKENSLNHYLNERDANGEDINKFLKYSKYVELFAKDFNYGRPDSKELVKMKLHEFQEKIINEFDSSEFVVVKKSRQMYMSQLIAVYCAWCMIFKKEFRIGIVSPKLDMSNRTLEKVRNILKSFSIIFDWEKDKVVDNKSEIRLSNGSSIKSFAANNHAGKGYGMDLFIFDEADFIPKIEKIWIHTGAVTMSRNGQCIVVSTPNKLGFLHNLWAECVANNNDFSAIHVDWTHNPDYTKNSKMINGELWSPWFDDKCRILNWNSDAIRRELYGDFVSGVRPDVSERINFRIEPDIYREIIKKIDEEEISISSYVKDLIKKDLGIN